MSHHKECLTDFVVVGANEGIPELKVKIPSEQEISRRLDVVVFKGSANEADKI